MMIFNIPNLDALQAVHAHSLLDNGNFQINQFGKTSYVYSDYSNAHYTVDRWKAGKGITVDVITGGIRLTNASTTETYAFNQYFSEDRSPDEGTVYTFAVQETSGTLHVGSAVFPAAGAYEVVFNTGTGITGRLSYNDNKKQALLRLDAGVTIELAWAAVYEGEYTAETLPKYIPKSYLEELERCYRHMWITSGKHSAFGYVANSNGRVFVVFNTPVPMRTTPTITAEDMSLILRSNGISATVSVIGSYRYLTTDQVRFCVDVDTAVATLQAHNTVHALLDSGRIVFDANLN